MPTRTHSTDPFAPRGSLSREQLIAYAEGRLTPTEQHEVELHLDHDPLLQDALEGLQQQGATEALRGLDGHRPQAGSRSSWSTYGTWFAGIAAVAIIAFILWPASSEDLAPENAITQSSDVIEVPADGTMEATPLLNAEIVAAVEQPESLYIGHPRNEHAAGGTLAEVLSQRDTGIDRIDPLPARLDTRDANASPRTGNGRRISRQLIYLHDLAVVDPHELYKQVPTLALADEHVAARFSDRQAQTNARTETQNLAYTAFMDAALGRFAANDHKGCLDDLRFVLNQYPDDVNALFYAGLCSYNLGMYQRARVFLNRAATHPVNVFDEEAQWYYALTLERLGENAAAQEAFSRIATADGFYAEKARTKLR